MRAAAAGAALLVGILAAAGCDPVRDVCPHPTGTVCTFAGTGLAALGDEDVDALTSHLYLPQDMTVGPEGDLYILDWNNHRIRQVGRDHLIHTVAGSGVLGDGPEGPALDAAFNHPTNVAFDPDGAMIIAMWHNSRVGRVDPDTGRLSWVAGNGERAFGGDGGPAADAVLDLPSSVAYDEDGDLYISDQANQIIRCISGGMIDTIAGQQREAGYSGDGGPATQAQLHASVGQAAAPANKVVVSEGVLYIADTGNHVIRSIDLATGIIDTVAGTGAPGFSGDGGPATQAQLSGPTDIAAGPDGRIYIADTGNSCVRVLEDGVLDTFAGVCRQLGYTGDEGPATEALFNQPYGVEVDERGNVFIADTYNHVIRVVRR